MNNNRNPITILISSYACGPNWGSEVGMGWNWVINLSEYCQLHVITEKGFQTDIENAISSINSKYTPCFYYVGIEDEARVLFWKQSTFRFYSFYKKWQKNAHSMALKIINSESIDIIHQLNLIGFREPGYLWQLNKPFVWGPIGGMNNVPYRFIIGFGLYGGAFNFARNIINHFQIRWSRRILCAARHSNSALIAVMPVVQDNIKKIWGRNSIIIPEVGASIKQMDNETRRNEFEPLKIIWSGMHHSSKALPLLLYSLHQLDVRINYKLHILGSGKQTSKWKKLAENLNINNNCVWYGQISYEKALSVYQSGHLFCITSLRDATSSVLMEAISFGLPIICPDHCGFAGIVDSSCGYKVKVSNSKNLIRGISDAIDDIYYHESKRQLLSFGSLEKAKQFSWKMNAERVFTIYQELLNNKDTLSN